MGNHNRIKDGDACNRTQLTLRRDFSRLVIHRDQQAHLIRFGHVLKQLKPNKKYTILDVGCGDKQLAMCIYSNKYMSRVEHYHAVDLRTTTIPDIPERFPMTSYQMDVTKELPEVEADIVTCFEVIEHVTKDKGLKLLDNLDNVTSDKSTLYLSTPCYCEKTGQANNHVYEWKFEELLEELYKRFTIVDVFGTFMNTGIGANKEMLEEYFGSDMMDRLKRYYHSQFLSNLFAPLFPEQSRNCMWVLRRK